MYANPFKCAVRCTAGYPKYPSGKAHGGEDYVPTDKSKEENWDLYSVGNGKVYISKKQTGAFPNGYGAYGNYIVYQLDSGYWVLCAHLAKLPLVKAGGRVTEGQKIGIVGSTGNSTGRHLHIEVADMRGVKYNSSTWYAEFCNHRVKPSDYIDFSEEKREEFETMKKWKNGSTPEDVYGTDTDAASKGAFGKPIRVLPARHTADCYAVRTVAGIKVYAIEYIVPNTNAHENGYVLYSGGVK